MKPLYALMAAVALFAFALSAQAGDPIYSANTLLSGSVVTNATTRTYTVLIDCSKQAKVGVFTAVTGAGADTGNVVFTLTRSVDGTLFETTGTTITVASNGTTPVYTHTEVDTKGAQFLKLKSIQNSATNNVTASVYYGTKIPGL